MKKLSLIALCLAALTGCAVPGMTADAGVTAVANLAIHDSVDRRVLQLYSPYDPTNILNITPITTTIPTTTTTTTNGPAPVVPWTAADIDHVKLALFAGTGTTPITTVTVQKADLSKSVRFNNLIRNTQYKVEARAWSDANETNAIDNLAVNGATCTTTFATATADVITLGDLKLRLKDKTFSGGTTGSSLVVTNGEVVDTTATSTIELQ